VNADDFLDFTESVDPSGTPFIQVRTDLFERLRRGPLPQASDLEAGSALTRLLHREFEAYGTDGVVRLQDNEVETALKALRSTLKRLGLDPLNLPFRNFSTFFGYWRQNGLSGSWQARRDCLAQFFDPLYGQLDLLEERELESELAVPASPRGRLGWPAVDVEIEQLRQRFRAAATPQDYSAVGTACVRVLEMLGDVVYDPSRHLREGEEIPPRDKTKQRIGRYVEVAMPTAGNSNIKGLIKAAIETAHEVKHRRTPDRITAGIAADAVILLANILRRLKDGDPVTSHG
jgi:hypothetical protein